jgi:large subunit ribosomal protein L9
MRVLLRQNVDSVGRAGEIKDVADGFARNYLIPRKLAVAADKGTAKAVRHMAVHLEKKEVASKAVAEEAAQRMQDLIIEIKAKVGEGTKLFGSVTHTQIQEALEKKGIVVDKRKIESDEHIRTLGTYTIPVKLYEGVAAEFTLEVVPEESGE